MQGRVLNIEILGYTVLGTYYCCYHASYVNSFSFFNKHLSTSCHIQGEWQFYLYNIFIFHSERRWIRSNQSEWCVNSLWCCVHVSAQCVLNLLIVYIHHLRLPFIWPHSSGCQVALLHAGWSVTALGQHYRSFSLLYALGLIGFFPPYSSCLKFFP